MMKFKQGSLVKNFINGEPLVVTREYQECVEDDFDPQVYNILQDTITDLDGFQYGQRSIDCILGSVKCVDSKTGQEYTFTKTSVVGPRGGLTNIWFMVGTDRVYYGNPTRV
jgi:hypothetical protein